jgi:menaquinone-dependent protoporphyrinogen IX oxidase
MRVLIVYASWFGHNRSIAKLIATELEQRGATVVCAPVTKVSSQEIVGYDLLVLGTYTHAGRASRRLRVLCETIASRRFERVAVAIFGTQISQEQPSADRICGVDDLEACLTGRGCELALAPLRIELPAGQALLSRQE